MASAWFQPRDYFYNKLAQMPYAQDPTGPEQLVAAFRAGGYTIEGSTDEQIRAAADQLEQHFFDHGMKENVSPNNYFDVDYYARQKIDQLNAQGTQLPPEGPWGTTWTRDALDLAMDIAHLSYWEHYLNHGMTEHLNPSAEFNTDQYITAKMEQLNGLQTPQPLPDGTIGAWTPEAVIQAFQIANLNPVQHYATYVETGLESVDYKADPEPGPDVPGVDYTVINLADVPSPVKGTTANENFVGTVASSQSNSTLLPSTSIDGNGGNDKLTVNMTGNFRGFDDDAGLKGISEVELNNSGTQSRTFNAAGIEGVQTWTLNEGSGEINLTNLGETGITVNINGLGGNDTTNIGFAKNIDGNSDALTLGLTDVGQVTRQGEIQRGEVNVNNVTPENLTLNVTGDNYVDLAGIEGVDKVTITGKGDLDTETLGGDTLDASAATGNLKIAMTTDDFQNATLGSGNDVLTITNIEETSQIDGGDGKDSVVINGLTGRYMPGLSSVETLEIDPAGNVYLDGTNIDALETLGVSGLDAGETLTLEHYDNGELNVNSSGNNAGKLQVADIDNVNFVVKGSSRQTQASSFTGELLTEDATSLSLTVEGSTEYANTFAGDIKGNGLEELSISADRNNLAGLTPNSFTVAIGSGSMLGNVSQVNVTGFGNVNLGANLIGNNTGDVSVDADTLDANLDGEFSTTVEKSSIIVNGGNRVNTIKVHMNNYSDVEFNGGIDNDTLTLDMNGTNGVISKGMLTANFGGGYGTDTLIVLGTVTKADFSGLTGVERIAFQDMTAAQIASLGDNLVMPADYSAGDLPEAGVGTGGNYVAPPNALAGGMTSVPSNATMNADASTAPNPADINMSKISLGSGASLDVKNIQEEATITTPTSGGAILLATTEGEVATDWTVNTGSAKGTTTALTINQGETSGPAVDQSLTINNTGEGTVSFTSSENTVPSGANTRVYFSQSELVLNNEGGGITEIGQFVTTSGSGTSKVATTYMLNMTNVDLNGNGDFSLNAQIGGTANPMTFNAQDSSGTVSDAFILGSTIDYDGSKGTDHVSFCPYQSGSDINTGTGEDQISISTGYMTAPSTASYSVINVHLGSDTVKDQVLLYAGGAGAGVNSAAWLKIDQFGAEDQLAYDHTGAANANHFFGEASGTDIQMLNFMNLLAGANTFKNGTDGNTTFSTITWGSDAKQVIVANVTGASDIAGQYVIALAAGDGGDGTDGNAADTLPDGTTVQPSGQYALVQVIGAEALKADNFCAYDDIAGIEASPF